MEVLYFNATAGDGLVLLTWETAMEIENLGFNLYRGESTDGPWTLLTQALIPSQVPPGSPYGAVYEYVDGTAVPGVGYSYWLETVAVGGRTSLYGPAVVEQGGRPYRTYLPLLFRNR